MPCAPKEAVAAARPPVEKVAAICRPDDVGRGPAPEIVISRATEDKIFATATIDGVVTTAAADAVTPPPPVDFVEATACEDYVAVVSTD